MIDAASSAPRLNVEVVAHGRYTWVYVERPSSAEVEYVRELLSLDTSRLGEALGRQQPKLVVEPGLLYLVLSIPVPNKLSRTVASSDVSFLVGPGFLVSVHNGEARAIARTFRDCLADEALAEQLLGRGPSYLLYTLVDLVAAQYVQTAEALRADLETLNGALLMGEDWQVVSDLGLLLRETTALRRLARTTQRIADRLPSQVARVISPSPEAATHWANLGDRVSYAWETLEACQDLVASLAGTRGAQAERRIARTLTFLSALLAVALPLLILFALFSMSLADIPLAADPFAFEYLLGGGAALALAALLLLRRQGWL